MSTDVKDLLVKRIQELEAEIQPMRDSIAAAEEEIERSKAALAALEGHLPTVRPRTAPRATTRAASPRTNGTLVTFEEWSPKVEAYVRQHPDSKVGEIAQGVEWTTDNQVLSQKVLKPMRESGQLSVKGDKRSMTYSVA